MTEPTADPGPPAPTGVRMRERLVRLPEDLDDAVKARAADDDRTIAATVRVALRHWLACPHKVRRSDPPVP